MLYGTRNYEEGNFLDWLATGSFNKNDGTRIIDLGPKFSVSAAYHSQNMSIKFIRGKDYDFWNSYRFTPLTSFQYSFLHQQAYNEVGGPPKLHITELSKNIVTLGLGAKFAFPVDSWSLIGMREVRAVVNYDVLNNKNITKANFIAGGASFNLVEAPARLSVKLGAGLTFNMADSLNLEFNYDFVYRSNFTDHTGMLKLRYLF